MAGNEHLKQTAIAELSTISQTVLQVVAKPAPFFREMPKTGGLLRPFIFMVVIGIANGVIQTVLSLLGLSSGGLITGVAAILLMPLMVILFGFLVAAVLFLVWKFMGSRYPFETAFRSMAYCAAITPITTVFGIVPYLGGTLGLLWMTYLLVLASIEVHEVKAKTAWTGFGAIGAVLILMTLSTEIAARKMTRGLENWSKEMHLHQESLDSLEDMSPEEAGRAVGDFLKGLQENAK